MNKVTLIASAISLALGVSACSGEKSPEESIVSAEQAIAQKDYSTAVIELKNAIVAQPNNPETRYLLGSAYIQQANYIAAEKELEKAERLGVTTSIASKLALTKLKLGKYEEVLTLLENNSNSSDEEYLLLLVYAGVATIQTGDLSQGQDFFSQAISINENAIYGQMAKAYLAQTNSDYRAALNIVEQVLSKAPETSEALLLKANLLYGLSEYQQAADMFSAYIKQKPQAIYVKYFQVNSLIKAQQFEQAEVVVDWMLSKLKNAPLANQYKAQIEYQKGNYREAKQFGEQAAQAGNQFHVAKMVAGLSAYQLKDIEQAYFHLRPLEQYVGNGHPVKRVLAIVKLELGYTDEAVATLNDLSDTSADFLQLASQELIVQGDTPSALSILDKAEKLSPNNAKIKAQKGLLMLKEGDEAGIQALEQAVELDDSLENVETALALEYLAQDKDDEAKAIADKRVAKNESKVAGLLLQGIYYSKQQMHQQAKSAFEQIIELDNNNSAALYNLAIYAKNDNDFDKAIQLSQAVIEQSPNHKKALALFVSAHGENKTIDQATTKLKQIATQYNYPTFTTLALASAYRVSNKSEQTVQLLKSQIASNNNVKAMYFVLLGDTYLTQKNVTLAKQAYQQGLDKHNNEYLLTLREIGVFEIEKDYQGAADKVSEALKVFPASERLRVLQANMEFLAKNYEKAKQHLNDLNSDRVKHHFVSALNGHYAYQAKNFDKATEHYFEAYQASPNRLNTLSLARALNGRGKLLEAAELLEKYLAINQDNTMRVLLAELYGKFDSDKAIATYKLLVSDVPNNAIILNNLAWQLYLTERYEEALTYAEKAVSLQQDNEDISDTYQKIKAKL